MEALSELKSELTNFFASTASRLDYQDGQLKDLAQKLGRLPEIEGRIDKLQVELQRPQSTQATHKDIGAYLRESDAVARVMKDRRGTAVVTIPREAFERKTTITSSAVGSATSGVLLFDRTPGIVPAARKRLFVRDLLTSIPTTFNAIDFVKVNSDIAKASPQVEGSAKYENAVTFTTDTVAVRTIATWIPATRQVLEDFAGLEGFIRESLIYAVRLEEENQLLYGSGTGENLEGLVTQAASFNTSLLSVSRGWEKVDILGRAIQQVTAADEVPPDFIVLHPNDAWDIRLSKDSTGQYIFGNPLAGFPAQFFGLTVIESTNLTSGTFLIGSSAPNVVVIRDRADLTVEISTEHADFFVKNMVAIRAEERLALVVFRPNAFVKGSLTTSPA